VLLGRAARLQFSQAVAAQVYYRGALIQQIIGESFGIIPIIMFWLAAGGLAPAASGYHRSLILFYFIAATLPEMIYDQALARNISMDIRMGKLSASLIRPFPFLLQAWMKSLGGMSVRIVTASSLFIIVMYNVPLLREHFDALTLSRLGLFMCAFAVGMLANVVIKTCLGLLAFDMTQTWGPELIYISFYVTLSGALYPIDLLPEPYFSIIQWTPLYYMLGFPTLVMIGRISSSEFWPALGQGAVVVGLTGVIALMMWRRGMKKFEAIGI